MLPPPLRTTATVLLAISTLTLSSLAAKAADSVRTDAALSASGPSRTNNLALLRVEDTVAIKVYQEPDLDTQAKINSKGAVSLALLGEVAIVGLTPEDAALAIQNLYAADYLVNPQVTVAVVERAKRRFTVLGQVTRPGVYEFPAEEGLNLLQALAMAGGYTRMASPSKVSVQRAERGEPRVFKLDADAMARQKDARSFEIQPEDVITVPERMF